MTKPVTKPVFPRDVLHRVEQLEGAIASLTNDVNTGHKKLCADIKRIETDIAAIVHAWNSMDWAMKTLVGLGKLAAAISAIGATIWGTMHWGRWK